IAQTIGVHHGSITNAYAIRGDELVLTRMESHGFDVNRDGSHSDEDFVIDYDKLTWSDVNKPGTTKKAALVLSSEHGHRAPPIAARPRITASHGETITLHIHADRSLSVRDCYAKPCTTTQVDKGDHDVTITGDEAQILASGATYVVHVERVDGDRDYPAPP